MTRDARLSYGSIPAPGQPIAQVLQIVRSWRL
jgi:hypothetical protein